MQCCVGKYGLEPGGTSCTIDYWHGDVNNYQNYVLFLVVAAYLVPVSVMLLLFLRAVTRIQAEDATRTWTVRFTDHQAAVTKVETALSIHLHIYIQPFQISPWKDNLR